MRKISVLFGTLCLLVAGAFFPASAQASTACDNAWHKATSGYFYAYDSVNCANTLGSAQGNDPNWNDRVGGFRISDSNKAHSLLHKGTSGLAVKVYNGIYYSGNWACLKKSEFYVSNLNDDTLSGGSGSSAARNAISSHKWVENSTCGSSFLR